MRAEMDADPCPACIFGQPRPPTTLLCDDINEKKSSEAKNCGIEVVTFDIYKKTITRNKRTCLARRRE